MLFYMRNSGTDDDLPPSHQNRYQRSGGRPAGNGRPSALNSAPLSRVHNEMETQIHLIEQEAYSSILRAFKAQSDAITWVRILLVFLHSLVHVNVKLQHLILLPFRLLKNHSGERKFDH